MNSNDREWASLVDIVEKIGDEADRLGCVSIADMCIDAVSDAEKGMSAEEKFFGLYQFLFRLYYRIKGWETDKGPFNLVYSDNRTINHQNVEMYRVVNYDWKMYRWARKRKFIEYMTNDWFLIPIEKLTEKEKEIKDRRKILF